MPLFDCSLKISRGEATTAAGNKWISGEASVFFVAIVAILFLRFARVERWLSEFVKAGASIVKFH